MSWLGEVRADWQKFMMKFKTEEGWTCLKGDPTLSLEPVSLCILTRKFHREVVRALLEIYALEGGEGDKQGASVLEAI